MVVVISALALVSILFIAQLLVGSINKQTRIEPRHAVFDSDELTEFCAQALPDDATATISYEDVGHILALHTEWIQAFHWSPDGHSAKPIIVDSKDGTTYVKERAEATGLNIAEDSVAAVTVACYEYLRAKGILAEGAKEALEADLRTLRQLKAPANDSDGSESD